jgi:hypothetical protein
VLLEGKIVSDEKVTMDVKQNSACAFFIIDQLTEERKKFPIRIVGSNRKYSFVLKKKNAQSDWLLHRVVMDPAAQITDNRNTVRAEIYYQISPQFTFFLNESTTLDEAINEKKLLSLKSAKKVVRSDHEYVEVAYDLYTTIETADGPHSGVLLLDPARYWCIIEDTIEIKPSEPKMRIIVKNTLRGGPLPIIERSERTIVAVDAQKKIIGEKKTMIEYDVNDVPNISDKLFTLSAFGLPEPKGVVWQTPTAWYLWIALAALAAFGTAYVIRAWRRRTFAPFST